MWPFLHIHCTYLLYICWCMFLSPTPYMCCFFSLFIDMFLTLVCSLLFLFHTKMHWWVLFKVFQKYRLSKSTCHKLSSCKVFQEFVLRFYCIKQVSMSWVFYDFSHIFICLLWFCYRLPKREIVRTYVFHLLGTYVNILCNWLILWQNALYLYLSRSKMFLILQETRFQDQVLKSSSLSKKTSWKCKFIKAWQLAR